MTDKKQGERISENTQQSQGSAEENRVARAHQEAEKDIEEDPELNSRPEPGNDLDEGELARLEGED